MADRTPNPLCNPLCMVANKKIHWKARAQLLCFRLHQSTINKVTCLD